MKLRKIEKNAMCKACGEPSYEFYIVDKDIEVCVLCKKKIDLIVERVGNQIIKETQEDERKRKG